MSWLAWKTIRSLYQKGASPGPIGGLYRTLRQGETGEGFGLAVNVLGHDIKRIYGSSNVPLVVAHPLLVSILAGRPHLLYQHGELVAPSQATVAGASMVLVPTGQVADRFMISGYPSSQIEVTGLCIEPALVARAESAFQARRQRLGSDSSLRGLFVSSGAEPKQHLELLISSVTSIAESGGQALVLARHGGKLEAQLQRALGQRDHLLTSIAPGDGLPDTPVVLASYHDRGEEQQFVVDVLEFLDYFVAPSHERTNWAVGLGLPMFALTPTIGPFAPLNLQLLLDSGTAQELPTTDKADRFSDRLSQLQRSGRLLEMAESGWGHFEIDGFATIATLLSRRYGRQA
jgi:hypothetical protein